MKKSFAEWGIEHFGQNFLKDYWDYEKNTIDPYKISYGSLKKIWIKCKDNEEEVNARRSFALKVKVNLFASL